jgi:hypothetical protein
MTSYEKFSISIGAINVNTISMKEAAKAWGEGKEVEWSNQYQFKGAWQPIMEGGFYFNSSVKYRLKPEVTTSLSDDTLREVYYSKCPYPPFPGRESHAPWFHTALKAVADAAIKQYIKEQK